MTVRLITIRPEPGCGATAAAARDFGLEVACHPLFDFVPVEWAVPDGAFDGILAGSAAPFRLGGALVEGLVEKPVYAVGETTAAAAWKRGFRTAAIGVGGLQEVLDGLSGQRLRLLRLCGEEHVPLAPPDGIEIETAVLYRMDAQPVPPGLADALRGGAVVLLHSAAAARHLAQEAERIGLPRERIALVALGPRIAQAAGEGWAAVRAAPEPSDAALLALVSQMCHEPFPR